MNIPTYEEVTEKADNKRELNALEVFVLRYNLPSISGGKAFRQDLSELILFVQSQPKDQ